MTDTQFLFGDTVSAFADKSAKDLRRMNLLFTLMSVPELTKVGTFLIKTLLRFNFPIKKIIKSTLFRQFCAGESLEESQLVVKQLDKSSIGSILDYSVEGELIESVFDQNMEIIRSTILKAGNEKSIHFAVFKVTSIGNVNVIQKVQKSSEQLTDNELYAYERMQNRIYVLCETAFQRNVKLLIDAEESWIQELIDTIVLKMMVLFNKVHPIVFITLQMYKTASLDYLNYLKNLAANNDFHLGIKLVRGAYMVKENERAKKLNYVSPIHTTKEATDKDYNQAIEYCLKNKIAVCIATHNELSLQTTISLMETNLISKISNEISFAQLYGMGDLLTYNLAKAGFKVAKYLPFGPLKSVVPYLFRRAEENTSITGEVGRELKYIRMEMNRRKKLN